MYGEIKKPFLLKDIPSVLLRSLPVIYYFSKYFNHAAPEKARTLFKTNLMFLSNALYCLSEKWNSPEFMKFSEYFCNLCIKPYKSLFKNLDNEIIKLAKLCSQNHDLFRNHFSECEKYIHNIYKQSVTRLQIFLFNPNGDFSIFNQVKQNLNDFCDYNVIFSSPAKNHFTDNILNSDFVLFLSVYESGILENVKIFKSFSKPGLALGAANFDIKHKPKILLNSHELAQNGLVVINKMYSPIRLYTTIDKLYLKHYLTR